MRLTDDDVAAWEIDRYLRALGRRVGGPRAARRVLVDEARDHVLEAAAAYRRTGLTVVASARLAIDDVGDLRSLDAPTAPAEHQTRRIRRIRRGAASLVAGTLGLAGLWCALLFLAPRVWSDAAEPAVLHWMASVSAVAVRVVVVAAMAALVSTTSSGRRLAWHTSRGPAWLLSAGTAALATCVIASALTLAVRSAVAPLGAPLVPLAVLTIAATLVTLLLLGRGVLGLLCYDGDLHALPGSC